MLNTKTFDNANQKGDQNMLNILIVNLVLAVVALALSNPTLASGNRLRVGGQACQGANYNMGQPVSDYSNTESFLNPYVFNFWTNFLDSGSAFNIPETGVIDPKTGIGEPATGDHQLSWVMGSLDAQYYFFPGVDPAIINTPLHEIPVIYDNRGTEAVLDASDNPVVRNRRMQLPTSGQAGDSVRNAKLNQPITLKRWNKARGYAVLGCNKDRTQGWVKVVARNLIPQMPYTAWEVFADNTIVEPPALPIIPAPLGGLPNTIIPDYRGKAIYQRQLHYCPLDTGDTPMMYIALLLHSDQSIYGAYFDQGGLDAGAGLPIGAVSADHLCIPVGNYLAN